MSFKKKCDNLNKMSADNRYQYFIQKVSDFEEVWSLRGKDGWLTVSDEIGMGLPVWPELEFAQDSATGVWKEAVPERILLSDFIEKWLPGLINDNIFVSVFPIGKQKQIPVDPQKILKDWVFELEKYE